MEDWCTPAEEAHFLGRVYRPSGAVGDPWALVSGRRVQAHGGEVHEKGMIARPLPDWLGKLLKSVRETCGDDAFPANVQLNHALVNEYEPGGGIMPHQDGPLYFPAVAIASLGEYAFALYLLQFPVRRLVQQFVFDVNSSFGAIAFFGILTVISILYTDKVERPVVAFVLDAIRKIDPPPPTSSPAGKKLGV